VNVDQRLVVSRINWWNGGGRYKFADVLKVQDQECMPQTSNESYKSGKDIGNARLGVCVDRRALDHELIFSLTPPYQPICVENSLPVTHRLRRDLSLKEGNVRPLKSQGNWLASSALRHICRAQGHMIMTRLPFNHVLERRTYHTITPRPGDSRLDSTTATS
jgi:hypothetical protein